MKRQHPDNPELFWCPKCEGYHNRGGFYKNRFGGKTPGECIVSARSRSAIYDKTYDAIYYQKNRARLIEREIERSKTDKGRKNRRKSNQTSIFRVRDGYIRGLCTQAGVPKSETMIELIRQRILMKRTLKEFKKWRGENEPDYTDVSRKQHADEEVDGREGQLRGDSGSPAGI